MSKSLNIKWYSTIKTKIAVSLIVPVFLLLGSFTAYNVWSEYKTENNELQTLATISAERMANHLEFSMWDLDNDSVKSALLAEMKEAKVQGIVVWDDDKKTVFEAKERRENSEEIIDGFSQKSLGKTVVSKSPIKKKDETIGEVAVYVYNVDLMDSIKKSGTKIMIAGLILIVLLIIILSIVLNSILVKPIIDLTEKAELMSKGQLDQNFSKSNDEIGYLSKSLDRMQNSLRIVFKKLNEQA